MTPKAAVALALVVAAVAVLAAALLGALTNRSVDLITGVGGLTIALFCRPISAWVSTLNADIPALPIRLGNSIGSGVTALAGLTLSICGFYGLLTHG